MQHLLNGGKALGQLIGGVGFCHTGDLLELGIGLVHKAVVLQGHLVAVAQVACLNTVESGVTVVVLNEAFQGLFPRDELSLKHIAQSIDLGADAPGLGIGQVGIDIDQDLAGLVQVLNHHIQVIGQNREAAHNDQAGHRNANSSEGHEAVEKNTPDALFEKVADIIEFHRCSTPLCRR